MITRIKEIHWWDAKAKSDAVTYKVWVEVDGQLTLEYFTDKDQLDAFVCLHQPPIKTVSKKRKVNKS